MRLRSIALAIIELICTTLLLPLSIQLQSTDLDVYEVLLMVDGIVNILSKRRAGGDDKFHRIFMKVGTICDIINTVQFYDEYLTEPVSVVQAEFVR